MEFKDIDIVPVEAVKYEERHRDPLAMAGGAVGVIVCVVGMLLLPVISHANGKEEHDGSGGTAPFEYVEARLLKLGEIKDDTQLPDRIVPPMPTAPEEIIALDKDEEKPEPVEKSEPEPEKQPDAVEDDALRQVFEKARAFAEIQDDYVPEGHPDGVPDGDVTDPALASMGATYGRRITGYIQDRWIVPTVISDAERNRLKVKVTLKFDSEMTIIDFKLHGTSGNQWFDDSIVAAIEKTQKEVRHLPEPPEVVAPRIYGGGLTVTMRGADAPTE